MASRYSIFFFQEISALDSSSTKDSDLPISTPTPTTPAPNEPPNELCEPAVEDKETKEDNQPAEMTPEQSHNRGAKENRGDRREMLDDEELMISTPTMTRMQYRANQVSPVVPPDSWAYIKERRKRESESKIRTTRSTSTPSRPSSGPTTPSSRPPSSSSRPSTPSSRFLSNSSISSRPSTPSSASTKIRPPKSPTSREDRGTKRKNTSPVQINMPEDPQPCVLKKNKRKPSPWPYMEQDQDEREVEAEEDTDGGDEEREEKEEGEEEGKSEGEDEEGEKEEDEGKEDKRRFNSSSYAKYTSNSTRSNPRRKQALNTRSPTTQMPKRAMCPPNSSTPYPATPYPCPFWGCPFAFRTREEIGPHFAAHDVAYASASLIRGVDVISLKEVDNFMFCDRYMKGSQPVVIKGTPSNWGVDKWDMEYLTRKYGNNQTVWYDLETERDEIEQYTGTFKKFTTELKNSATLYASVIFTFPKKWKKLPQFTINYMDFVPPTDFESYCRLFIGHTGTFTALHRDFLDTTITAVKGTKRVILFPPDSFAYLQQLFPPLRTKAHKEDFVHFFFDLSLSEEDRSKVMDAGGRVVFLQPGFSLYIPGGWYHQVSNLEENTISLSNACVTRYNISFFIQNEHPEQLSMSQLLTAAIDHFYTRVRDFSPPVIVGRNKAKVLKIGTSCKENNNYKSNSSSLNVLVRFLEEAYDLEAALHARVKVEEDANLKVIKVEKHVRRRLHDTITLIQDLMHNL